MFEKFTGPDAQDFRQRYEGTYGFFIKGDQRILVRLDSINTEDVKQVSFSDKDGIKYKLRADSDDDSVGFEFLPPKNSYHNTLEGTYLLKRIPTRQYSRGICDRNTSIQTVSGRVVPVDFKYLHQLFGKNPSPKEMLALVQSPAWKFERSIALSSQFAIQLDNSRLYCFSLRIGEVALTKDNVVAITLDDPSLWQTELRDCFSRTQIQGTVA